MFARKQNDRHQPKTQATPGKIKTEIGKRAQTLIITNVQNEAFAEEIKCLEGQRAAHLVTVV